MVTEREPRLLEVGVRVEVGGEGDGAGVVGVVAQVEVLVGAVVAGGAEDEEEGDEAEPDHGASRAAHQQDPDERDEGGDDAAAARSRCDDVHAHITVWR